MKRRWFIVAFGGTVLACPCFATAQSRVARVAVLTARPFTQVPNPAWPTFVEALRKRGWEEGRNVEFQLRAGEGNAERYEPSATELVALKPDVIITGGSGPTQAIRQRTSTIPIVMVGVGDPLGVGFVASLARPGGNVTGFTNQLGDLGEKNIQLLKELRPGLSRTALFWNPENPASKLTAEAELANAPRHGLAIQSIPIKTREDLEAALAALSDNLPEALNVHIVPILAANVDAIANFALQHRLPSFTGSAAMVRAGLLASYAPDPVDQWRRAADYVDRILRGANPAEMPVEQPTKFEFVINLKTAKAIGLAIPQPILMRADQVIE